MKRLTLFSYAKVNLYLAVIGRLPHGYHELVTIFERIDVCDTIELSARRDRKIVIHCSDPDVPVDRSNLCYKSAELIRAHAGRRGVSFGADIVITKRIPVGAGLGGGSSNAAVALSGLNRLWKCGATPVDLTNMAGRVGSDVAFFTSGASFAIGTGRGEIITPLDVPRSVKLTHVLVVPRVHVSTPRIYEAWDGLGRASARHANRMDGLVRASARLTIESPDDRLCARNDLEPLTAALYPEVGRVKIALLKSGVSSVLMSGSGPAVFGLVAGRSRAEALKKKLLRAHGNWRVYVAQTA